MAFVVSARMRRKLSETPGAPHVVVNPRTGKRYVISRSVNPGSYALDDLLAGGQATDDCYTVQEVWNAIVESAWATGEPGVCFLDRINENNPTPQLGRMEACNPCGEQPLLPYEACNLGSINVSKFVAEDGTDLDWHALHETIRLCVRFLDDVIDASHYPVAEIKKVTLGNRKIGLGIMGFADALILLRIPYGGEDAVQFAERLASFVQDQAHAASAELAKEKGTFPNWEGSVWDTEHHRPMRNATCTTMAPTGTISILADCSSGIEPIFSLVSERIALDGDKFPQLHPLVERLGTAQGWLTDEVQRLLGEGVPPREIPPIPKALAEVMVTAHEVSPKGHVRIQAAFQKYTDNAVSKTVNLPASAAVGDVDETYRLAFRLGCKGITVYRDGCRDHQVITSSRTSREQASGANNLRPRVRTTAGTTTKFRMGCGTLFVTVNRDDQGLCEVFANLGKAGGCPAQSEATCRAISVALRSGVEPGVLSEQLRGIRCLSTIARRQSGQEIEVLSCPDAIARAIEEALGASPEPLATSATSTCPDCHYPFRKEAGCNVCDNCGFSKCG